MKKILIFVFFIFLSCKQEVVEQERIYTAEENYVLYMQIGETKDKALMQYTIESLEKLITDSISIDLKSKILKSVDSLKIIYEKMPKPKPIDLVTDEDIDKQFSNYNGSHIKLEEYIITNMNNPDSSDHVSSSYKKFDDYSLVLLKFRGTNAYGGVVTQEVSAKCSLFNGDVIEIIK